MKSNIKHMLHPISFINIAHTVFFYKYICTYIVMYEILFQYSTTQKRIIETGQEHNHFCNLFLIYNNTLNHIKIIRDILYSELVLYIRIVIFRPSKFSLQNSSYRHNHIIDRNTDIFNTKKNGIQQKLLQWVGGFYVAFHKKRYIVEKHIIEFVGCVFDFICVLNLLHISIPYTYTKIVRVFIDSNNTRDINRIE